jgi:LysW-gamma-L-lysine/LysW-L-ornithine aminotransferase
VTSAITTPTEEPTTKSLMEMEDRHFSGGTTRRPVMMARGAGCSVWDQQGREYLDLSSAQGWANIGHCHPTVTRAIQEQAQSLVAQTESSYNPQRAQWYSELSALLEESYGTSEKGTLSRIHVCNSGAEAIEAAIKTARFFTRRTEIVACKRAFHGRTMGALSATWNPQYRQPFEPLVPGFRHIPYNETGAIAEAVNEKTAAVLVEPVQGEGGVFPGTVDFLLALQKACRETGALLMVDEIQTGFGRTAKWFGGCHFTESGFTPDMIALGKSLGGGLPMGALAWRSGLGTLDAGTHGSTFGGNPLACAASRATFRVFREERLIDRSRELSDLMFARLRSFQAPLLREIRGIGLMAGIELRQKVTPVLKELMQRGVWALPAGPTVLRLLPPLVISESDLCRGLQIVEEVLRGAPSR